MFYNSFPNLQKLLSGPKAAKQLNLLPPKPPPIPPKLQKLPKLPSTKKTEPAVVTRMRPSACPSKWTRSTWTERPHPKKGVGSPWLKGAEP